MSVSRLQDLTSIGVEQMGALADRLNDPGVLRLENLDTDLRPPASAIEFTKRAIDDDAANSYLPFLGSEALRRAAADLVGGQHPPNATSGKRNASSLRVECPARSTCSSPPWSRATKCS